MGWIGVDLFFVLSGFLVSGLLFKEYTKYNNIKPALFLIRRGFKIYPLFYIALAVFTATAIYNGHFSLLHFLSEVFFFQNYFVGFGWALYGVSWSIAIEEHFYFGLVLALFIVFNKLKLDIKPPSTGKPSKFELSLLSIMLLCLIIRLVSLKYFTFHNTDFTMTHHRIDSLLAGVLVSYLYQFRLDYLKHYFNKIKPFVIPIVLLLVSFTPFIKPTESYFVKTIGFSMLYTAFALLLVYFLLTPDINQRLNKTLSKYVVNVVSYIGIYSYSIYICHMFVVKNMAPISTNNKYVDFIIFFGISVLIGKLVYDYLEAFFLKIRDKYFPNRIA